MAFSFDGSYIACTLYSGEIQIWKTATGALHSTLDHYEPGIAAVKFLQNGTLASMYRDGTVRLFDQVTGVICRIIERPTQDYEPPLGSEISVIKPHGAEPSLFILPGGDLVILLPNGRVWTWSWEGSTWSKFSFPGITINRFYGCLSNGTLVAGTFRESEYATDLFLLDPHTSAVQSSKSNLSSRVMAVAVSSLDVIAWGAMDGTIELYDAHTGSLSKLEGHPDELYRSLTFSPDGSSLVSGGYDLTLRLWDLSTRDESLVDTSLSGIDFAAFSLDGKHLAAISSFSTTIQLYGFPINTDSSLRGVQKANIASIHVSPDGQQIAAHISHNRAIQIYNTGSGALEHTMLGHSDLIVAIAFSHDGERLVSASHDETIRLWLPKTGASGLIVSGISGLSGLREVAFSPNGKHLVSGNEEGTILILDAESGALRHEFRLSAAVAAVTFSADGRSIACATSHPCPRSIGVWDTSTGKLLHEFGGSESPSMSSETRFSVRAAISPNGNYLSYSLGDMAVIIYDISSKQKRDLPDTVRDILTSLAFSRDSESLATCTRHNEIKLWDVASARLIGFYHIKGCVERLSFPADGTFLESEHGHIPICHIQADASGDSSAQLTHWRYSWYDKWMMEGARKMLWIPPAYRSYRDRIAHHAGLFAIARSSGGIAFLGFIQGELVTDMQE